MDPYYTNLPPPPLSLAEEAQRLGLPLPPPPPPTLLPGAAPLPSRTPLGAQWGEFDRSVFHSEPEYEEKFAELVVLRSTRREAGAAAPLSPRSPPPQAQGGRATYVGSPSRRDNFPVTWSPNWLPVQRGPRSPHAPPAAASPPTRPPPSPHAAGGGLGLGYEQQVVSPPPRAVSLPEPEFEEEYYSSTKIGRY
eukprot:TRINITY_DN9798_c0_g1_i1.p1 TRINITY_DN9798_c0_g1~~TRINITY_DN9798_c0_g1_i1.p1  ORF type:complete len:193 (-),score=18.61 TRINITY_DN9798_c0_g1_i1:159-737(-)